MMRLVILGLLALRPMSGYEIQQVMQLSQLDQWSDVLPGSIYHALKKMTEEGLLELQSTEQTGHRTKAIYAITEPGRQEYLRLLRAAWQVPPRSFPSDLYLLLSFVGDLPRAEVLAALDGQIAELERRLTQWDAGLAAKEQAMGHVPATLRAAFANGREHMEVDLRFLQHLRESLSKEEEKP